MKTIAISLISIVEIPFIFLTWIDYYWNQIWKHLSGLSVLFVVPSILTLPVTWIDGIVLSTLVYLKHNLDGDNISFEEAIRINLSRFPDC